MARFGRSFPISPWISETVLITGSLTLTPSPATAVGVTIDPFVIDPETPAIAIGATVGPTVVLGSLTLTPSPATAVGATVGPTVVLGSLTLAPSPAAANGIIVNPTVILGSITNIPNSANVVGRTIFDVGPPPETIFLDLEMFPDVLLSSDLFPDVLGLELSPDIFLEISV